MQPPSWFWLANPRTIILQRAEVVGDFLHAARTPLFSGKSPFLFASGSVWSPATLDWQSVKKGT
jgi:hypothetical protein